MRALRGLCAALAVAVVVVLGVWVTGGLITNDFGTAMLLTTIWLGVAGLASVAIGARSRSLRVPVIGAFVLTAAALGVYLGSSMFLDDEVDEDIVTASEPAPAPARADGRGGPTREREPRNVLVAQGGFQPIAHAVRGRARVIDTPGGERFVTLSDFEVDNGPDLRVYVVRGRVDEEADVDDYEDLGALKGNKGNQQYRLPERVDVEGSSVVIWCRAFSVAFASAPLEGS